MALPRTATEYGKSGILSARQLQAASLPNVLSLFNAPDSIRSEVAHFLQRFILDGFARGVDVPAIMKSRGTKWDFHVAEIGGNAIGDGKFGRVRFDEDWYPGQTSYMKKLQLFYHEMGHAALDRGHTVAPNGTPLMLQSQNGKLNDSNWESWIDGLFSGKSRGRTIFSTRPEGGGTAGAGFEIPFQGQLAAGGGTGISSFQRPTIQPTISMGGFQPLSPTIPNYTNPTGPNIPLSTNFANPGDLLTTPIETNIPLAPMPRTTLNVGDIRENVFSQELRKLGGTSLAG